MALISILSGGKSGTTASVAGVTARTIRNWRKLPVFQEALADARRDYFSACRSHVNASLAVAFETVLWTSAKSWSDGDRLKAALFLLDRGNRRRPKLTCRRFPLISGLFRMDS